MANLSEAELKRLIKGGETTTVELKVAAPRSVEIGTFNTGKYRDALDPLTEFISY